MLTSRKDGPSPLLSFSIIFGFALIAAWLFYGILESTGAFKYDVVELGGAAAGFLTFFWFGHKVFGSLAEAWERRVGLADKNAELQEKVAQLTEPVIPKIERPEGFVRFSSKDYGLGFSRPQSWSPHEELFLGIFKRPVDAVAVSLAFQGNIAVTVSPYSLVTRIDHPLLEGTEEEVVLKAPQVRAIETFSVNPQEVTWDETYIQNRRALRASFDYVHFQSGTVVFAEIVTVLDPARQQIFIFALHEAKVLAAEARDIFRRMMSTVILWEPSGR